MSATAFQRMRRLQTEKAKQDDLSAIANADKLKVADLKAMLDKLGIEYDPKAKREELIELLKPCDDGEAKQDDLDKDGKTENSGSDDNQSKTTNNEEGAE